MAELLGQLVASGGGEHRDDPGVLRDALGLRLGAHLFGEVCGESDQFLRGISHGQDDSASASIAGTIDGTGETAISRPPATKEMSSMQAEPTDDSVLVEGTVVRVVAVDPKQPEAAQPLGEYGEILRLGRKKALVRFYGHFEPLRVSLNCLAPVDEIACRTCMDTGYAQWRENPVVGVGGES